MPVALSINGRSIEAAAGPSLFDYAERLGVRVPTSCRKQGKCRECLVEVAEGMACLSAPVEQERHLNGDFRLSCRTHVTAESGRVQCHTMRRGHMRIERGAVGLPAGDLDLDGHGYGIAADIGTTTVVLRLLNLATGELAADASFENPQRFG
ncbi:MAG TPA: 2Fe-2S iron-sulfur cluster-binding protein, partial [Bryobacteraceae bacterium]